jgi:tRNA nucleotidyltransferase (CCA-adding enzyme)
MSEQSPFQAGHEERHRRPSSNIPEKQLPKKGKNAEEQFFGTEDPLVEGREKFRVHQGLSREEYTRHAEERDGKEAREMFERVCKIAEAVKSIGGRALLVGGSVRDEVLGISSKDFDLEVYKVKPDDLEKLVHQFGKVDSVGKAFGILKITDGKMDIDVSIPRRDSKVHEGHKGFEVDTDPNMSIAEAGRRRDFTFNALSKDPLTGEIFDPFNGVEDLRTRTLRVTDPVLFKDDPLRVMRGAQFIGRFGLRPDQDSMKLFQEMVPSLRELPKERMCEEWNKLLLKSERPSLALQALFDMGVIKSLYPELVSLSGTPQEFDWHPEGDVWTHTLMVVDSAKDVCKLEHLGKEQAQVVMLSALCHDLGKPETTEFKDGRIKSQGHEPAGAEPTKIFLQKIGVPKELEQKVIPLVKEHLWPGTMYRHHLANEEVTPGAFRRLAKRIWPATIAELTFVAESDNRGRGPFADAKNPDQFVLPEPYEAGKWVREEARRLGVEKEMPKPIMLGRDLIALGFKGGKDFWEPINVSEQLRDEKNMTREELIVLIKGSTSIDEVKERMLKVLGT